MKARCAATTIGRSAISLLPKLLIAASPRSGRSPTTPIRLKLRPTTCIGEPVHHGKLFWIFPLRLLGQSGFEQYRRSIRRTGKRSSLDQVIGVFRCSAGRYVPAHGPVQLPEIEIHNSGCVEYDARPDGRAFLPPDLECHQGCPLGRHFPFRDPGRDQMRTALAARGYAPGFGQSGQHFYGRPKQVGCNKTHNQNPSRSVPVAFLDFSARQPIFIKQWPNLGVNNLAEPFPSICNRYAERRGDIAVPYLELRPKTGVGRISLFRALSRFSISTRISESIPHFASTIVPGLSKSRFQIDECKTAPQCQIDQGK